jgi:hypothetical protein
MPMATEPALPWSRRKWLLGTAALAASQAAWSSTLHGPEFRLLTAWDADDQSWAGVWTPGQAPRGIALPNRAHEVLASPVAGQALAVARRPGEFLVRFDTRTARVLQWHDMEPDRLLSGHAVYSPDGQALYTAEFDAETGAGIVAERDPKTLRRRREFESGGIGPHALMIEPQGTMLVANGGLLTLPETGRRKLNRDSMDASLARLDPATGRLIGVWRVDDPYLSLRHLARAPDGTVAVAMQAEHASAQERATAPLLALLEPAATQLRCIALPASVRLQGYGGDVAYLPSCGPLLPEGAQGSSFVVSATQAGQLAWWSVQGGWQGQKTLPDAGALAAQGREWLACGGAGRVEGVLRRHPYQTSVASGLRWDNHARFY